MKRFEGGDVEYAYGCAESPDGNFIIAGNLGTGLSGADACLAKLAPDGTPLWIRAYGGSNGEDARAVVVDRDSGLVFTGRTNSFGAGASDVLLAKTDRNGVLSWARTLGGNQNEYGIAIDTTADGGYIVGGYTYSSGAGNADFLAAKFTATGTLQWSRAIGGTANEFLNGVLATPDGGYLLSGSTTSFGAGSTDIYLVKLDAAGNLDWTRSIGGPSADSGNRLCNTSDGQVVIAGNTNSFGQGGGDGILLKMTLAGSLTWARTFGTNALDRFFDVFEARDQRLIVTGEGTTSTFGSGDQQIVKVDGAGNLVWARHYGTNVDETGFGGAVATSDGGILLTGWDDNDEDFLITKTDSNGLLDCNVAAISLLTTSPVPLIGGGGNLNPASNLSNLSLPEGAISLTEITYCSFLLPLQILHFQAGKNSAGVQLTWELESGGEAAWQTVERAGNDQIFQAIGRLKAAPGTTTFRFLDPQPDGDHPHYRIAVHSQNGEITYSEIREVRPSTPTLYLSLHQTSQRRAHLKFPDWKRTHPGQWSLWNTQGQKLQSGTIAAGSQQHALQLATVPAGIYLLRVRQAGRQWQEKVWLRE